MNQQASYTVDPRLDADSSELTADTFRNLKLDWVTALAAQHSSSPMALLSVALPEGTEYLSVRGFGVDAPYVTEALRGKKLLCEQIARSGVGVTIHDRHTDVTDPLMVKGLAGVGLRAYYGVPLVTPSGFLRGALCVGDGQPRHWYKAEVEYLNHLAESVCVYLEWAISESMRKSIKVGLPSSFSHLVRTSLTSMQASLEMLVDDDAEKTPTQARMAEIAHRNCRELVSTMEEVLATTAH